MKTKHTSPPDIDKVWQVIPNPDPSNTLPTCCKCGCTKTFAVQHTDGGFIRFYNGRTMDRKTAEKLKQELESNTKD